MSAGKKEGIEVFQELYLDHPEGVAAARQAVLTHVSGRWEHEKEFEADIREDSESDVIAFGRSAAPSAPGVSLWMHAEADGRYKVSNVTPVVSGQLGIDGYNSALQDFVETVVLPASRHSGLTYSLSGDVKTISDWADKVTCEALTRFSRLANKSTGRSHPSDEGRWLAFLIEAHKTRASLDTEQLAKWLNEVEGWPYETAWELGFEYGISRTLLAKYDEY